MRFDMILTAPTEVYNVVSTVTVESISFVPPLSHRIPKFNDANISDFDASFRYSC